MPLVIQNVRRDGHSGLSIPITVGVCVGSSVVALTLGVFAWIFIVWKKNKDPTHPSSTAIAHQPRKPEESHFADPEQARDQANQIPSLELTSPPAYSPGLIKRSSVSNKKSTPPLNVDVDFNTEPALPSPLRSASFNPSAKTQSLGSRISSHMSAGTKILPRMMVVVAFYVPSLSDELPIRLGETVYMIEEYEDEWCLVQRVGQTDERGVVPRFCLTERQETIQSEAQLNPFRPLHSARNIVPAFPTIT